MIRCLVCAIAAAMIFATGPVARAQQDPGARAAGGSYVPSTHSPGCKGLLCDSDDPRRAPGAPPPPACEGLLCVVSPYALQRPVTAGDVQRIQEEQARATAAAAAAPSEPEAKGSHKRRKARTAKTKSDKAKSVVARTPDPGSAAPEAR